jgi:hypothetical protein
LISLPVTEIEGPTRISEELELTIEGICDGREEEEIISPVIGLNWISSTSESESIDRYGGIDIVERQRRVV